MSVLPFAHRIFIVWKDAYRIGRVKFSSFPNHYRSVFRPPLSQYWQSIVKKENNDCLLRRPIIKEVVSFSTDIYNNITWYVWNGVIYWGLSKKIKIFWRKKNNSFFLFLYRIDIIVLIKLFLWWLRKRTR